MEKTLTIKPYAHGMLKNGRSYQIIAINNLSINSDMSIKDGELEVDIYTEGSLKSQRSTMRISEFLREVSNIGNEFI